jgi:hypothetical protein
MSGFLGSNPIDSFYQYLASYDEGDGLFLDGLTVCADGVCSYLAKLSPSEEIDRLEEAAMAETGAERGIEALPPSSFALVAANLGFGLWGQRKGTWSKSADVSDWALSLAEKKLKKALAKLGSDVSKAGNAELCSDSGECAAWISVLSEFTARMRFSETDGRFAPNPRLPEAETLLDSAADIVRKVALRCYVSSCKSSPEVLPDVRTCLCALSEIR